MGGSDANPLEATEILLQRGIVPVTLGIAEALDEFYARSIAFVHYEGIGK